MLAALQRGTTLVVDRYAFSGVAFTAAKGRAGLDLDWCRVRTLETLLAGSYLRHRKKRTKQGCASSQLVTYAGTSHRGPSCGAP